MRAAVAPSKRKSSPYEIPSMGWLGLAIHKEQNPKGTQLQQSDKIKNKCKRKEEMGPALLFHFFRKIE